MGTKEAQELGLRINSLKFSTSHSDLPHASLNPKEQPPLLHVVQNVQVVVAVDESMAKQQPVQVVAPVYDFFQPMLAHFSERKSPKELKASVKQVLERLVEAGVIDFYEEKTFVVKY